MSFNKKKELEKKNKIRDNYIENFNFFINKSLDKTKLRDREEF
jgi:hypothetical protein